MKNFSPSRHYSVKLFIFHYFIIIYRYAICCDWISASGLEKTQKKMVERSPNRVVTLPEFALVRSLFEPQKLAS